MPHVPCAHAFDDGSDGILDGDGRIEARRLVDVDVVGPEPLERVGECRLYRRRASIKAQEGPRRIALRPELHLEEGPFAVAALQSLAQQELVAAHSVEVARVEECDPGVQGRMDGGEAFCLLCRP